ncbi:hypothetical protein ACFY1L_13220 [Streptomyces sp. NPDC001663]|uniref:hypothetical protein n=1 Tax=Streptomyces sp. NPDC001663 TaxID=3364597 RepID=UPI00369ECD52
MRWRNTVAVLVLLPLDALAVGYGWMAVIWTDEPHEAPLAQLGVLCGVVAAVGAVLWPARLRGAAVFQFLPVLMLATLLLSSS